MSGPATLAALQRLAALKAQRALAALSAARAREAAEAAGIVAAELAAATTYDPAVRSAAEAQLLWRRRLALEAEGQSHANRLVDCRRETGAAAADAAEALARELGAAALVQRAQAERRLADARRLERSTGVLAALRAPLGR